MNDLRHLDLFSGIGGFAFAARMAGGIQTVAFSEIEPYACAVLAERFPGIPNLGDIHQIALADANAERESQSGRSLEQIGRRTFDGRFVDLITGGFPCQPFSVAGKRGGASDDRALWPQMLRVIEAFRPAWVIGENVTGIITMELDRVLSDLEGIGYSCRSFVIPACAVDAKHRRDRVWIVAHAASGRRERRRPRSCEAGRPSDLPSRSSEEAGDVADSAGAVSELAGGARQGRSRSSDRSALADADSRGIRRPGTSGNERHTSFGGESDPCAWQPERDWFAQSGMGRVAHGISARSHRLRGLGNAIVPQVAAEIFKAIIQYEPASPPPVVGPRQDAD